MVSVGNEMGILSDGSSVAREKFPAEFHRLDNFSSAIGRKGVSECGCNSAVVGCAAASLAASAEDVLGIS